VKRFWFFAFTGVALSGCLDWDALRGSGPDASISAPDSGTAADPDAPRVAWYFLGSRSLTGAPREVSDDAPAAPEVTLSLVPSDTDPPEGKASLVNGTLVIENAMLRSDPAGYAALLAAITANAGNLSIELWVDATALQEPGTLFAMGADTLSIRQSRLGIAALFETTGGQSDLQSEPSAGSGRHHVIVTWRPANGLAILYIDGQLAALDTIMNGSGAWPASGGSIALGSFGWSGSLLSVAIFDRALDEAAVLRRYNAGPQ
jgi:Concanavalin A-like lectin/glucanases superfamily